MKVVVYTTVIGDTDKLRAPTVIDSSCQYVCYTDRPKEQMPVGWQWVPVVPAGDTRLQSRQIKILSHKMLPKAHVTLWIDAAYRLDVSPRSLLKLLEGVDMVAMRHPHRNRIVEEGQVIVNLGMVEASRIRAQVEAYQATGFDTEQNPQQAITSTGFLLRRQSPLVAEFERRWWNEVHVHCYRDQMSVDYVINQTGVRCGYIPGHYRDNPHAKWFPCHRNHPNVRPSGGVPAVRTVDVPPVPPARRVDSGRRWFNSSKMQSGTAASAPG